MPSAVALHKTPQSVTAKVPVALRVEDSKWRERAACLGASIVLFEIGSEDPDQPPVRNVLHRSMEYCVVCPVRRDCVVDALSTKDTGVIRGGIKLHDKMKRDICSNCKLPVTTKGRRCTYCTSIRVCGTCGCTFAATYAWLKQTNCRPCREARAANKKPRRLRIIRTETPKVRSIPRRRK